MTQLVRGRVLGGGEAGHPDTPSDLRVRVELSAAGGVVVEIRSKVAAYYGRAIEEQVRSGLAALEVEHARVVLEDQGALPFTIAARLEAAVRGAGAGAGKRILTEPAPAPARSGRARRRRSRLYLPGSTPRFFVNAGLHRPDAVILDLEDSVAPADKDSARILVRNALRSVQFGDCERMVRINQHPLGLEDLRDVVPERPDVILVPKVETPEEILEVDAELRGLAGGDEGPWLMPILESALGVENAFAVASASPRVAALTIGLEDLTADLGVVKTDHGAETLYSRQRLVIAARAAGVQAIDSVYGDVEDPEGLFAYGRASRAMGFEGMGCIHPRQIAVIHEAFAPTEQEIEKALRIVEAFEEAEARGLGVVSLGTRMIDPPVVNRARRLIDEARELGLLSGNRSRGGQS